MLIWSLKNTNMMIMVAVRDKLNIIYQMFHLAHEEQHGTLIE